MFLAAALLKIFWVQLGDLIAPLSAIVSMCNCYSFLCDLYTSIAVDDVNLLFYPCH
jgi:hypothetical protein